jgi:hypothetical protein
MRATSIVFSRRNTPFCADHFFDEMLFDCVWLVEEFKKLRAADERG